MRDLRITTDKLFDGETIAAGGSVTSVAVDLRSLAGNGIFSLHTILSGSGVVNIEYLSCPTEAGAYLIPSGATDIMSSAAAGSDLVSFGPELTPFMKIKVTETGGISSVTIDKMWLNKQ